MLASPTEVPGGSGDAAAAHAWLTRNLTVLSGVSFLQDTASELLYPILPVFITVILGAPAAVFGTIEGLAEEGRLHPIQEAFLEHGGLQCGFCTPGMVMSALEFAKVKPGASEQEVRESLEGNLCRCTGYHNIVKAIMAGSKAMAAAK